MNILEKTVSYYKNVADTKGIDISLFQFLKSTKHADKVSELRAAVSSGLDTKEVQRLKTSLPACTISGRFSERTAAGLIEHSGLIAIDIDEKDNKHLTNFSDIKNELSKLDQIAYCGLSCSGRGYFALIPLAYPKQHLEQFEALKNIFEGMGLTIDPACKDVCRLRFYSYDAEAYFNPNATPFTGLSVKGGKAGVKNNFYTTTTLPPQQCSDTEKLNDLVKWCKMTNTDLTVRNDVWIEIAAGLSSIGEAGRYYFHEISSLYPGYNVTECDNKFTYCLKKNYKFALGTVFYYAKEAGWSGYQEGKAPVLNIKHRKEPEPPLLTSAQKLAAMKAINPLIDDLCTRLGFELT